MGEARDELRKATSEAHRLLDENPLVAGLAAGSLPSAQYGQMLTAYLAFYEAWEVEIKRAFPELAELAGSFRFEKSAWLKEDLAALREIPDSNEFEPVPIPQSLAAAAGAPYVVEGSTIGGMHLSKSGKLPSGAARFFQGYGDQTMAKWREWIETLEKLLPDEDRRNEAIREAGRVFGWFRGSFDLLAS